ncbi:DUF1127 domain-containing protein [Zavarzinia compransoris]|uniref:DUF1127 domain-containing protein n=1 Tax=Zavarzinia marina TaxID=2911065 RepID=UPI001F2A16DA|nr:DUF1127 domain-containing protein [Zavarzinia marina]MCF4165378.1 DUF1127 domain-containing protein [Zavarzinia marina]
MTECIETNSPALPRPAEQGKTVGRVTVWTLAARAVTLLLTWQSRVMERNHLRMMDDRMLQDIGLSRADIEGEATKPFWKG